MPKLYKLDTVLNKILNESCLDTMSKLMDKSINMVMTSPPYWVLRDYGIGKDQLGLEPTFDIYIQHLCDIFDEVKRVLRDDGTCWVNLGDTYVSSIHGSEKNLKMEKCLAMIPYRFAIEMVNRGWILRNTIIWHKQSCMPSSVKDRFTVDYEYLFFFSKKKKYYFEMQLEKRKYPYNKSIKYDVHGNPTYKEKVMLKRGYRNKPDVEHPHGPQFHGQNVTEYDQGRNKRTVWTINPTPFPEAHFAVYPEELCETPIKAGCPEGGIVYDPFFGSGTTGLVAHKLNRKFIGSEISKEYCKLAEKRLRSEINQVRMF